MSGLAVNEDENWPIKKYHALRWDLVLQVSFKAAETRLRVGKKVKKVLIALSWSCQLDTFLIPKLEIKPLSYIQASCKISFEIPLYGLLHHRCS